MNVNQVFTLNTDGTSGPAPWPAGMGAPSEETIPDLFDRIVADNPEHQALVSGEVRLTYGELCAHIDAAVQTLGELGVGQGTRMALLAPNSAEWIIAAFAALRLGATVSAFHTWVKARELDELLISSRCEVLVMAPIVKRTSLLDELTTNLPAIHAAEPLTSERYPVLRRVAVFSRPGIAVPEGADELNLLRPVTQIRDRLESAAASGDIAFVLYTSGTTKAPKGVPLRHRELVRNGFGIGGRMGLSPADKVWLGSPLFWSFGIANAAMATLTHGATLVLEEDFSPAAAARTLAAERCTAAYLLPSIARALFDDAREEVRQIESLRTGLTIGRPDEVELAAVGLDIPELCNVYGATEVYGNCCVTPYDMPLRERLITQGPPLPDVSLRVVGPSGEVLAAGEEGELQIRGHVMSGYLENSESTRAAFSRDGWYRTGDTARLRADGCMEFVGRHTEMVKTSGINVSPADVESVLSEHPDVAEVAVTGAAHSHRGEVVVAFVVPEPGSNSTADDLEAYCRANAASFKVPWAIDIVNQIPRTSTGKLRRQSLKPAAEEIVARLTAAGKR